MPDPTQQSPANFDQQQVTHGMAPCIVQGLEAVEVDIEKRPVKAASSAQGQYAVQLLLQVPPIGKLGERVVIREPRNFGFGRTGGRDVVEAADVV